MSKRVSLLFPLICLFVLTAAAVAQQLPDFSSIQDLPSTSPVAPRYERLQPLSIHSQPDFLNVETSAALKSVRPAATPFTLANVISVPNFQGSFGSRGKTWHFTMIGTPPSGGATTTLAAKIVSVSLKLQNANLVTFTTVSDAGFETPTLNSPNFKNSTYTSGSGIEFADAVQRAEFFHTMKSTWHTRLSPATIVQRVTITVPRFVTITLNGKKTQVRTYFTQKASDGHTVVFLLDQFFNQQIFNLVVNQINAGRFKTNTVNVAIFPNTFLYSVNNTGGIGPCCTLGFHTFFTDNGTPKESRWIFAFASWTSPGVFGGGFADITALSHEISEALNDPFVNNLVPAWQFPNQPGSCQDNLETGDPVEVLSNIVFPVKIGTTTFHPQTEALLQWFEQKTTSSAINGAFSYPNTKALPKAAVAFGPLTCP